MYRFLLLLPLALAGGFAGTSIGILQVVLGFGALIFVHELGHFLVAKWMGVRVEEFSVGFGPFLFTWRRGPTIYALRMIPLGGFVKMRGQHDLQIVEDGAPDSYLSKTVPQRMAIIVAGVTMNVIFAYLILVVAFWGPGIGFNIAQVARPREGGPAASAKFEGVLSGIATAEDREGGLRRGDLILEVNGSKVTRYIEVLQRVAYGGEGQAVELVVRRDPKKPTERELKLLATPRIEPGFGLASLYVDPDKETRKFFIGMEIKKWSEVNPGRGALIALVDSRTPASRAGIEPWDIVRSVDGQPIADAEAFEAAVGTWGDRDITLGIERDGARLQIKLRPFSDGYRIGIRFDANAYIDLVFPGSAAEDAKLKAGDLIVMADGKPFDVKSFIKYVQERKDRAIKLVIKRDGKLLAAPITVAARRHYTTGAGPRDINVITRLSEGPAKDAGIQEGDYLPVLDPTPVWVSPATITVKWRRPGGGEYGPASLLSTPADGALKIELDEGVRRLFKFPLVESLTVAYHEMGRLLADVFYTLHGLIARRVPAGALSGPVGIFSFTYKSTKFGIGFWLWFLAMISANLAVINLLPIPVLDGGHMLFLSLEAIRRKPVSQRVLEYAQIAGLLLLLALILFVTKNDILRFFP